MSANPHSTADAALPEQLPDQQLEAEIAHEVIRLAHELDSKRQQSEVNHAVSLKHLERKRIEEQVKNLLSETRVRAQLVESLPGG